MRLTQRKGDIAVSQAVATFTKLGYDVSIPITESAAYDLIVDTGSDLARVQVKYTSTDDVDLRKVHSNSNGYVVGKYKDKDFDWLYVYTESGDEYIYQKSLIGRTSLALTKMSKLEAQRNW